MNKATIKRDSIFVGQLVKKDENSNNLVCRSILFTLNENTLATDLLYNSPNYPISNLSNSIICEESEFIIMNSISLAPLLLYFCYGEYITEKELKEIKILFLSGTFTQDNCDLFGRREILPKDHFFYENDLKIINPLKIYLKKLKLRLEAKGGKRSFILEGEEILPMEYWITLDILGNNSIIKSLMSSEKRNNFKPNKNEGKIKRKNFLNIKTGGFL